MLMVVSTKSMSSETGIVELNYHFQVMWEIQLKPRWASRIMRHPNSCLVQAPILSNPSFGTQNASPCLFIHPSIPRRKEHHSRKALVMKSSWPMLRAALSLPALTLPGLRGGR